jgi:hypothetical protein
VAAERAAEEADTVGVEALDDKRCWPGTPHWQRRQAQYKVIWALWEELFPGDVLPKNQMNQWLCMFTPQGDECELVVDNILAAYENNQRFGKKPIEGPKKYITDCLRKATDPDHGDKRRVVGAQMRAAAIASGVHRPKAKAGAEPVQAKPAQAVARPGPKAAPGKAQAQGAMTLQDVARLYQEAGFDYEQDKGLPSAGMNEQEALRWQLRLLDMYKEQPLLSRSRRDPDDTG